MMDLRGTGRSTGCLDHIAEKDATDMEMVIEWLADQEWSNGRVGMTGHSYVGSTPNASAALAPDGLVTIAPSAGLASMYDHQFNKGVPWLLQWAGPMFAYEALAMERDLPPEAPNAFSQTGDNWENAPNPQYGCGWQNSSLAAGSGQVTGQYEAWHAERDWREGAAEAEIPIFMIHGVHDNAARIPAAEWFFDGRYLRDGDKVWIGQWDHGSDNGRCGNPNNQRVLHPTCRFSQFQYAVHAWFDYHLKEMTDVDTGPAVEAFLNGEDPMSVTAVRDPETWGTRVLTDTIWRRPAVRAALYPDATDGSLGLAPPEEAGTATFVNTNAVLTSSGSVTFTSDPLAEDTVFLGLPLMRLNASLSTGQIAHLVVTLFREDAAGNREPLNFCAIQPQLRHGVHDIAPVVPLQEMALPLSCFTMAGWVPEGQKLVMQVAGRSPHHASFGSDQNVTIYTGPGRTRTLLPVVPDAVLHDDVPLREG
jgi:predicted acyl esterase